MSNLDNDFEYIFKLPHERDEFRFRLFDLPPELWLHICGLAVTKSNLINPTHAYKKKQQLQILKQPAITRTCRLLRQECLPVFYYNNEFEAYHWEKVDCIRDWLVAVGPSNRRAMGTLTFHCKFDAEFWTKKFADIGILVKIDVADDQSRAFWNFKTLIVTFL